MYIVAWFVIEKKNWNMIFANNGYYPLDRNMNTVVYPG